MSDDGGAYVRSYYQVPAHIDAKVRFDGQAGVIVGFKDQYLLVDLGDGPDPAQLHPTWRVEYLESNTSSRFDSDD
jgi:hypothetical protein